MSIVIQDKFFTNKQLHNCKLDFVSVNEDISINEECRKAKAELSEYENTRLLNKQYTIERMNDSDWTH